MNKKNTTTIRVWPETKIALEKLCAERYSNGLDKKQLKIKDLAAASLRIPNVTKILKESKINVKK